MLQYGAANLWKIEAADLGKHYRWANDGNLRRLLGASPHPRSVSELEAWYGGTVSDPTREVFSIKLQGAELVGWAQLYSKDLVSGSAEVAVLVEEEEWGKGYGHDSLTAVVKYAFEDLRLNRVGAEILTINLPSIKLFQKVGFIKEGTKRESYYTSGRYLDTDIYSLLAREFVPHPARSVRPEQNSHEE